MFDFAPIISAASVLLGVIVTGLFALVQAERQAKRASEDRQRERSEQRAAEDAKAAEAAAFESLTVARHLEAYAKECADVVAEPWTYTGESTYPRSPPTLKAYGAVAWPRLGAVATAKAFDLVQRHQLRRSYVTGDAAEHVIPEMRAGIYGDGAARLGIDAWETAVDLRKRAGLPAFVFVHDSWDFVETLRKRAAEADAEDAAAAESGL